MSWIVMALDECGHDTRIGSKTFDNEDHALIYLDSKRENYPEYRSFWVEELHDKEYYIRHRYEDY